MINRLHWQTKKSYTSLLDFITHNFDEDFYLTSDNKRIYISEDYELKKLLKESLIAFTLEDDMDYTGLVVVWCSVGGDKKRYYVKLVAKNKASADSLLTQLSWVFQEALFAKVSKKHKFLPVFRKHGYKFLGGRGRQILLHKDKPIIIKKATKEEE